jgi:benzoate membrane transport protein
MLLAFFIVRLFAPMIASIAALAAGFVAAYLTGQIPAGLFAYHPPQLEFIEPVFSIDAAIGLAIPLYLVTMASQNLAGAAVLKAQGYTPPMGRILTVTGGLSILGAPFAAHTINLAAISAAICTGPDVHPDKDKRWPAGIAYAAGYAALIPLCGALFVWLDGLPKALVIAFAGLALIGSFAGALTSAVSDPAQRFAAATAFAVSASGLTVWGVGAAFWGLVAGLVIFALDTAVARFKSGPRSAP